MLVVDDFIPAPQGSSLRVRETRRKEKIREIIFEAKTKNCFYPRGEKSRLESWSVNENVGEARYTNKREFEQYVVEVLIF